jgi:prevent-host-death family protein
MRKQRLRKSRPVGHSFFRWFLAAVIIASRSNSLLDLVVKFSADLATEHLMKLTRDIHSLSTFKRDTAKLVRQMKKTKQPVVLTVNGKAALVVQDAESYQKLLEAKNRMEAIEGIKRGLESMKRHQGKPAGEFFNDFFAEKGIATHE